LQIGNPELDLNFAICGPARGHGNEYSLAALGNIDARNEAKSEASDKSSDDGGTGRRNEVARAGGSQHNRLPTIRL